MTRPAIVLLSAALSLTAAEPEFFEMKVRPLLASKCYACHTKTEMGGLRLDSRDAILKRRLSRPRAGPGRPRT